MKFIVPREARCLVALGCFIGAITLSVPVTARAGTFKTVLETMGYSVAVGAILGAATLPFYSDPSKNTSNIATGAAIGAGVGVGILGYGLLKGNSDEQASIDQLACATAAQKDSRPIILPSPRLIPQQVITSPLLSYYW